MKLGGSLLAATVLFATSACAVREAPRGEAVGTASSAYREALREATRSGESVETMAAPIRVSATLLTPRFREALGREQERLLGPHYADPELESPRMVVLVALTAGDRAIVDLRAYNELWTLAFETEDAQALPAAVEPHGRKDAYYRYFFPYWTPWRNMYRVEFPFDATTDTGTLHFRSVSGSVQLTW